MSEDDERILADFHAECEKNGIEHTVEALIRFHSEGSYDLGRSDGDRWGRGI